MEPPGFAVQLNGCVAAVHVEPFQLKFALHTNLHSAVLGVMLYVPMLEGVQSVPFQVWVMLDAVFQEAFAGSPVQVAD